MFFLFLFVVFFQKNKCCCCRCCRFSRFCISKDAFAAVVCFHLLVFFVVRVFGDEHVGLAQKENPSRALGQFVSCVFSNFLVV